METTKYYSEIKCCIASKVGNSDDVEDLVQRVFLEFYCNKSNSFQNPKSYLWGIAKKLVASHYRAIQKRPQTILIASMEEDCSLKKERDYADQLKAQKLKKDLKKSLEQLSSKDYETIRLCLSEKFSAKETAQREEIPVAVFYKRYQRALKILRKISSGILKKDCVDR